MLSSTDKIYISLIPEKHMLEDYAKMAFSNLTKRKLRSWLTMLGIFIGIATIVALISLGQGLEKAVMDQFSAITPNMVSVTASEQGPFAKTPTPLTSKELRVIESTSGIESVAPRIMQPSRILYGDYATGAMIVSIPDGKYRKTVYDVLSAKLEDGKLLQDGDKYKVVLGYNIAHSKSYDKPIKVGDYITLNDKRLLVIGLVEKKGSFLIDGGVYINEDVMIDILGLPKDEYNAIGAFVADGYDMKKTINLLEKRLRKSRDVKEENQDFVVEAALDNLEMVTSTLFGVQLFIYIIAGVSIVVGGIGIMNTMFTSVLERTKEIGIMKAIGATNKIIFVLFFIESGFLGFVGGVIGVLLGTGLGFIIAKISSLALGSDLLQAHFTPQLLIGSLLFSFLLGSLSGLVPALKAAKLHPVVALSKGK